MKSRVDARRNGGSDRAPGRATVQEGTRPRSRLALARASCRRRRGRRPIGTRVASAAAAQALTAKPQRFSVSTDFHKSFEFERVPKRCEIS